MTAPIDIRERAALAIEARADAYVGRNEWDAGFESGLYAAVEIVRALPTPTDMGEAGELAQELLNDAENLSHSNPEHYPSNQLMKAAQALSALRARIEALTIKAKQLADERYDAERQLADKQKFIDALPELKENARLFNEAVHRACDEAMDDYKHRAREAERQLAEARKALEPFAADMFNDWLPDETPAWYEGGVPSQITIGDFRRARAALQSQPKASP